MKKLTLLLMAALSMAALNCTVLAAEEDTPLHKEMAAMNKALRTLKKQADDPAKKDENIELVAKVKTAIDNSCKLEPATTKKQADKPAYVNKYKEEMVELGKAVGELEMAIKVSKADDAKKAVDKIFELKKKGHDDFIEKE